MNNPLDKAVENGMIKSYSLDMVDDTNRAGDDLHYEVLTIEFNDGSKVEIQGLDDNELLIAKPIKEKSDAHS